MTSLAPRPTYTAPGPRLKSYTVHYTTRAGFRASWKMMAQTKGECRWSFEELPPTGKINLICEDGEW